MARKRAESRDRVVRLVLGVILLLVGLSGVGMMSMMGYMSYGMFGLYGYLISVLVTILGGYLIHNGLKE